MKEVPRVYTAIEKENARKALLAARGALKGMGRSRTDEEFQKLKRQADDEFVAEMEARIKQKHILRA